MALLHLKQLKHSLGRVKWRWVAALANELLATLLDPMDDELYSTQLNSSSSVRHGSIGSQLNGE